ncbi:MAG: hypothetical protein Q4C09_06860 [Atopobiaceae bacterium]|nr:hypothetical protein [Atopobiaceae bacterium]
MSATLSVALAASIIGCASTANNGGQATDEPEQAETSQAKDYTTGTPWQDIDLDGVVTKDTPTDVKDNYALYVNKDKVLDLEIPPGYPCGGTFVDSYLKRDEDIRALFTDNKLSESDSHDTKLALSLYQLMTDWDGRNAAGVTPLKKQVDAIEAIDSLESLTDYQVDVPVESQIGKFWSYKVEQSLEDSNRYLLKLESPQLLLEDSAEYAELTDYGSMKKEAKTELAHKMLVKLGYTEDEVAIW